MEQAKTFDGSHQEAKASIAERCVQRKPLEMVSFPGLAWGRKAKVITVDIWKISALCFATKVK